MTEIEGFLGFTREEAHAIREAAEMEDESIDDFFFNAVIDRASNTLGRAI